MATARKPGEKQSSNRKEIMSLIYGGDSSPRFTQDSPILPDVWLEYVEHPERRAKLLLTPYREAAPGKLASTVHNLLHESKRGRKGADEARIAYNEAIVAADLTLDELLTRVLPLSPWWAKHIRSDKAVKSSARGKAVPPHRGSFQSPRGWLIELYRQICLPSAKSPSQARQKAITTLFEEPSGRKPDKPLLWLVSRNRAAKPALDKSVRTVKADAASKVFDIKCSTITWAILDTGVDARHPAFSSQDELDPLARPKKNPSQDWSQRTRIAKTYSFLGFRDLLSMSTTKTDSALEEMAKKLGIDAEAATDLRQRLRRGKDIDWVSFEPFLQVKHDKDYTPPENGHGTHVAGILGANGKRPDSPDEQIRGMCKDIQIIDLRVLDANGEGDEFSILAALQFVRYLNRQSLEMSVHGVNLSISIPHDVKNFACGRTPICDECRRLVGDGIVVVAAAGNEGHHSYMTSDGSVDQYSNISITDPGNAEEVITVGSTHRSLPHAYGVSYFSSRGPTGDGRVKPDLVAPGEKILAPVPDNKVDRLDGTSMATAHVSGAAALLMAAHREFIGEPLRVKKILCDSATDLGREKYFQGHGMVDVLRAIQSV